MPDLVLTVGGGTEISEHIGALKVIAGNFEERQQVHAVHNRNGDIRRKCHEAGKELVQVISHLAANASGIAGVQHRLFGITRAQKAAIWQRHIILSDGKSANKASVGQMRTIRTEVFFLAGELISKEVNGAGYLLAANRTPVPRCRDVGQQKNQAHEEVNKSLTAAALGNS